jgi:starch phosphorylase
MNMTHTTTEIREAIRDKLQRHFGRDSETATQKQIYRATCSVLRDMMTEQWMKHHCDEPGHEEKEVIYLSMEFLPGTSLRNNLFNLNVTEIFRDALNQLGFDLEKLQDMEPDAGLGNGGLGRLASCYLDALATQRIFGHGMSICYEYGIFKQKIRDGRQEELPDDWLTLGDVWLVPKDDEFEEVRFGGKLEEAWTTEGKLKVTHKGYTTVVALPRDMLITGYDSPLLNTLRLWESTSPITIDMKLFAEGKYLQSMEEKHMAEVISKILYPEDAHREGKLLRMKQQYFFISASMQYLVKKHFRQYGTLDNFQDKLAIHINDTHPTMAIPELIRIFVDEYEMDWNDAWDKVRQCISYTNHTVMPEALESWPEDLFRETLPRLHSLIQEINRRQHIRLMQNFPNEESLRNEMAILAKGQIRMANLCVESAHTVNGVSGLHSQIIRKDLFPGFARETPGKFTGVTNGIAYRRWLCQANPQLCDLIEELIGGRFRKDASELEQLRKYEDDKNVLRRLSEIKKSNKRNLASYVENTMGIRLDADSVFDVQVKRLHEYKRQLLNLMHILYLYLKIKENPNSDLCPRTFFFAAKSAAGYHIAKEIIHLANSIAGMLEKDPAVRDRLKVVFLENYSVSLSERIMPAAEVSEQISLAGKEASGTGNMKLMINGALTVGTLDGANVEILRQVGNENMFLFGMTVEEVEALVRSGSYDPWNLMQSDADLSAILRLLSGKIDGVRFTEVFHSLTAGDHKNSDAYFILQDFASYKEAQQKVDQAYRDTLRWNRMSLHNIAGAGLFSADRAVLEYADRIWHVPPMANGGSDAHI